MIVVVTANGLELVEWTKEQFGMDWTSWKLSVPTVIRKRLEGFWRCFLRDLYDI